MNVRRAFFAVILLGIIAPLSNAAGPAKLALQGGRIIPVVGDELPQGTLLIENGTIKAIGADLKIPYDAVVVDVSGKVLFPGMISPHTYRGLDRSNENLDVAPYLDVYDAIDPSSLNFENALRDGALAVHIIQGNSCVIGGLSRLLRPIGRTPDEMTLRPAIALKMSTSPKSGYDRMSQMASLRAAFLDLEEYLENVAEQRYAEDLKRQKKEVEVAPAKARELGRKLIRDQDCDDKHRNLYKLVQGRLDAWIYCGAATDVAPAIQIAKDNGFLKRTVFVLGTEAYRACDEIKATGRPVVLAEELVHQQRDPITGKLTETFVPKVFHDAGIRFALQPDLGASLGERYLTYQAARCARNGIPRDQALEAITIDPAKMLGVADRLGSLEVGKAGYVLVLSGDPLDFNTWVEEAYIEGQLAYQRTADVRLQKLLGLERKQAEKTKPKPTEEPQPKEPKPTSKPDSQEKPKAKPKPAEKAPAENAEKKTAEKKNDSKEKPKPKVEPKPKPEDAPKPDVREEDQ